MPIEYRENPKHKPGCTGNGPPRWFPSSVALCPDDVTASHAQMMLDGSIEARDASHPNATARYAIDARGRFFKAYSEDGGTTWHGYPVREELVPRQVPSRVLREFVRRGTIAKAAYKRLLGDAR